MLKFQFTFLKKKENFFFLPQKMKRIRNTIRWEDLNHNFLSLYFSLLFYLKRIDRFFFFIVIKGFKYQSISKIMVAKQQQRKRQHISTYIFIKKQQQQITLLVPLLFLELKKKSKLLLLSKFLFFLMIKTMMLTWIFFSSHSSLSPDLNIII